MKKSYYKKMTTDKLQKKYCQAFNCYYHLLLFLRIKNNPVHYTKKARRFLRRVKKEELKAEKIYRKRAEGLKNELRSIK